jgi:hypothetical protein
MDFEVGLERFQNPNFLAFIKQSIALRSSPYNIIDLFHSNNNGLGFF